MSDGFNPTPVRGKKTGNNAAPGNDNIGAIVAQANAAAQTWTEGYQVPLSVDLSGALRVTTSGGGTTVTYNTAAPTLTNGQTAPLQGDTNGNLKVVQQGNITIGNATLAVTQSGGPWTQNLTQVGGNAIATGNGVTGTGSIRVTIASDNSNVPVTLATALPTGGNVIGAVTQSGGPWTNNITQVGGNAVNTGAGTTGTGTLRVTIASDNFSAAAPLYTRLSDGANPVGTSTNPLYVHTADTPGTLTDSGMLASGGFASPTDVAAGGGTSTLVHPTAVTNGVTAKLVEFTFASTVTCRVELQTTTGAAGATVTTRRTFFVAANAPFVYAPASTDTVQFTSTGTGNGFQIKVTNLDNNNAAPVYGTISYAA